MFLRLKKKKGGKTVVTGNEVIRTAQLVNLSCRCTASLTWGEPDELYFFFFFPGGGKGKGKGGGEGVAGQWVGAERGDLSKARSLILHSAKRSHDAGGLATAVKAI